MALEFTANQWSIFQLLIELHHQNVITTRDIVSRLELDNSLVTATLTYAEEKGWVTIQEKEREELLFNPDALQQVETGLPERQALNLVAPSQRLKVKDLADQLKNQNVKLNEVIKWGSLRNWLTKENDEIIITNDGLAALSTPAPDEQTIQLAFKSQPTEPSLFLDELPTHDIDPETVKLLLKNRPTLAKIKPRIFRYTQLTNSGRKTLDGDIKIIQEKNQLSSDDILSGNWKNIRLRRYDVTLPAENVYPAKIHPFQRIIQEARKTFLEMGFTEVVSPQVESAFWDFDALFQPQDHPARDMQDTFYLSRPHQAQLPDPAIVEKVKATHQNGGDTGSKGWGYQWNSERARQMVLRTHTTACTIRALAANPQPPRKVFCVGKVFRNEAISYKHLPEFFQVDGIIIDEHASLATLLGTLKEFYSKMGFSKIRFKPDFFPYTEPSIEVSGFMDVKNQWVELGGSGIFRPEVTRPFGCLYPCLAWGLGLERLAMMRYGLKDIRELYWSDLDETKEIALCQ